MESTQFWKAPHAFHTMGPIFTNTTPSGWDKPLSPLQEPAQQKHLQQVISNKTKLAAMGVQTHGP